MNEREVKLSLHNAGFGNAVSRRDFAQIMARLYGGTGTGRARAAAAIEGDKIAALAALLCDGPGKLSKGVQVGAGYRVQGKGRTAAAAVHCLASLGDALPAFADIGASESQGHGQGACLVSLPCLDHLPVSVALGSMYHPAGPLLQAVQGQGALALAKRQAGKLLASMRRQGATPSNATEGDAVGDGVLALLAWRQTYGPRLVEPASVVCWRACVASVARADMLGESIELWRADDSGAASWDWLCASALPLPQLVGDGSRFERASRLRFERARAGRLARLARRLDGVRMRAQGRRVQVVDKLHLALVQLLHGASLDDAATAAGFKASGHGRQAVRAGDRLCQAARRLGYRVQFTARQFESKGAARGWDVSPAVVVPLSPVHAAAWRAVPSASLPLDSGRGGVQWVAKLQRLQRKRARVAKRQAASVASAARVARASAKRASLRRWQARQAAKSGLWEGAVVLHLGNLPQYGHGKRRRY